MASSDVKKEAIELQLGTISFFGERFLLDAANAKYLQSTDEGGRKLEIVDTNVVSEVVAIDIAAGNLNKIDHIIVNREMCVSLIIKGVITRLDLLKADFSGENVTFNNIRFKTKEGEEKFNIMYGASCKTLLVLT